MKAKQVREAWVRSLRQISGAAIAIAFGVALVQIMKNSATAEMDGMMTAMAKLLSHLAGKAYILIAPLIGVLGSFVSGSNTVSNLLFTNLQYDTASQLGISTVAAVALQVIGGAVGSPICINSIVAASATVGLSGAEGKIIKTNLLVVLLYTTAATLLVLLLDSVLGWIPM
jgi:lactate permease